MKILRRPIGSEHVAYFREKIIANTSAIRALRQENEQLTIRIKRLGKTEQRQIRRMRYQALGLMR